LTGGDISVLAELEILEVLSSSAQGTSEHDTNVISDRFRVNTAPGENGTRLLCHPYKGWVWPEEHLWPCKRFKQPHQFSKKQPLLHPLFFVNCSINSIDLYLPLAYLQQMVLQIYFFRKSFL